MLETRIDDCDMMFYLCSKNSNLWIKKFIKFWECKWISSKWRRNSAKIAKILYSQMTLFSLLKMGEEVERNKDYFSEVR